MRDIYQWRLLSNLSLRLILIVPFLLQIVGAVSIVGYLSFRSGQQSVNNIASKLRYEVSKRVEHDLLNYLEKAYELDKVTANQVESGQIDLNNIPAVEHYLWSLSQIEPRRFYQIAKPNGNIIFVQQLENGTSISKVRDEKSSPNRYVYKLDSRGNRLELINIEKNFDPRTRPWYKLAVKAKQTVWTPIYTLHRQAKPVLGISLSIPTYDRLGKLQAVSSFVLDLNRMTNFIQHLQLGPTSRIFLIEENGDLIADSAIQQPFIVKGDVARRIKCINSDDPILRSTTRFLLKKYPSFGKVNYSQQFDFLFQGEKQFVQVLPVKNQSGNNYLVVVVVPESEFMEQINANNLTTLLLCVFTLFTASILGWFTSGWISQPLLKLSLASEAIASGNLEQKAPDSFIKELNILSSSFNRMSQELKAFYQNLESRIEEVTQKLYQTQAQLVQNEKMSSLAQLVAGIAHEVNNPASFIQGNLGYLSEYNQRLLELLYLYKQHYPEEIPEIQTKSEEIDLEFLIQDIPNLISSIKSGSERIRDIVKSLRSFSRLDEAELKNVDIHEGIDICLMIIQNRLEDTSKSTKIEVIRDYAALPLIECYAGELNQVFMNILLNAVDALETCDRLEKKTIQISTKLYDSELIGISITDNGTGMTEEVKNKLFDPFFTTKAVGKAKGMGMSISYQIVTQRHHGALKCFSEVGKGTEILIEIPTKQLALNSYA